MEDEETVLQYSQYPPIMQDISWPLAIPFKEQRYHRSPSESIGNNYTPTANNLKIKDLKRSCRIHKAVPTIPICAMKYYSPLRASQPAPKRQKLSISTKSINNGESTSWDGERGYVPAEKDEFSESRPMTPMEQINLILEQENDIIEHEGEPTNRDYERYLHYIDHGIQSYMIEPQKSEQINRIEQLLSRELKSVPELQPLRMELLEEVNNDYDSSLRKAIVDYVLKDPSERLRLFIASVPQPFPHRVIRAPVPWHNDTTKARAWNESHLFVDSPMMTLLQDLWHTKFDDFRFVRVKEINTEDLPLLPQEFEGLVKKHCAEARGILETIWIPTCANLFVTYKEKWMHLVPQNDCDSIQQVKEFFACAASIMSLQLRGAVIKSLEDLLLFFTVHKDGNDFGDEFHELRYVRQQIMILKLKVEEPKIVFEPSLDECWDLIHRCYVQILNSANGILKVECELLPELLDKKLTLHTVQEEESLVNDIISKAMEIFNVNIVGPQR